MPLKLPPKDGNGRVIPHDHDEIVGEDRVIRRITDWHLTDMEGGGRRLSSAAFEPSDDGQVSVDIEKLLLEANLDPGEYSEALPSVGSICWSAQYLRSEQLKVGYDPLPNNPYHGGVWNGTGRMSRGLRKRIISNSSWLKKVQNVEIA